MPAFAHEPAFRIVLVTVFCWPVVRLADPGTNQCSRISERQVSDRSRTWTRLGIGSICWITSARARRPLLRGALSGARNYKARDRYMAIVSDPARAVFRISSLVPDNASTLIIRERFRLHSPQLSAAFFCLKKSHDLADISCTLLGN